MISTLDKTQQLTVGKVVTNQEAVFFALKPSIGRGEKTGS
jgi:hypothetical protein